MRRYLPYLIVVAVALVTLGSATMLYRAKHVPGPAINKGRVAREKETEGSESGESATAIHFRGKLNAPVTLEEFGDFECPPCSVLAGTMRQIEKEYGERLCVVFKHFPLAIHPHARQAALVAEAAGMQNRFWEMHDLLYREQPFWSKAADVSALFNAYAGMLGLNLDQFKKDMESRQAKERIAADQKRAAALGVTSTPTIFINGKALPPSSLNAHALRSAIEEVGNTKSSP
jgi:protein-disulfide isomerase